MLQGLIKETFYKPTRTLPMSVDLCSTSPSLERTSVTYLKNFQTIKIRQLLVPVVNDLYIPITVEDT